MDRNLNYLTAFFAVMINQWTVFHCPTVDRLNIILTLVYTYLRTHHIM